MTEKQEFKGIVILEDVLYDSNVPPFAKLIYGELLKATQGLPAGTRINIDDAHLAELYKVDVNVVKVALKNLAENNYLSDLEESANE